MTGIIDLRRKLGIRRKDAPAPVAASISKPASQPLELEAANTQPVTATKPLGMHEEQPLLAWEAPEFDASPERKRPLLIAGGMLVAGGIIAIALANYFFALFLVVAGVLLASFAYRSPKIVRFALTPHGVVVDSRLYELTGLASFWIAYEPPLFNELRLVSKKTIMPIIRLPLGEMNPLDVREILTRFLPEKQQDDTLIEILSRYLGF